MNTRQVYFESINDNLSTAEQLFTLKKYHIAYDYYDYIVRDLLDKGDVNNTMIYHGRMRMLYCQFHCGGTSLSVMAANINNLLTSLSELSSDIKDSWQSYTECYESVSRLHAILRDPTKREQYVYLTAASLCKIINKSDFSNHEGVMGMAGCNFSQKIAHFERVFNDLRNSAYRNKKLVLELGCEVAQYCLLHAGMPNIDNKVKSLMFSLAKEKYKQSKLHLESNKIMLDGQVLVKYVSILSKLYSCAQAMSNKEDQVYFMREICLLLRNDSFDKALSDEKNEEIKSQLKTSLDYCVALSTKAVNPRGSKSLKDSIDCFLMPPPKRQRLDESGAYSVRMSKNNAQGDVQAPNKR